MFSMDPGSRICGGYVVVALYGELDVVDAADVAAALETVARREPRIIVDLAGLEFIDCGGLAALARGRQHARHAGGDLVLAAPHERILRILAIIGTAHGLPVHAGIQEAAATFAVPGAAGLAHAAAGGRAGLRRYRAATAAGLSIGHQRGSRLPAAGWPVRQPR